MAYHCRNVRRLLTQVTVFLAVVGSGGHAVVAEPLPYQYFGEWITPYHAEDDIAVISCSGGSSNGGIRTVGATKVVSEEETTGVTQCRIESVELSRNLGGPRAHEHIKVTQICSLDLDNRGNPKRQKMIETWSIFRFKEDTLIAVSEKSGIGTYIYKKCR